MSSIDKYIKIARDALIKPSGDIEGKIIDRISHIKNGDSLLLDEKFLDFFKKNNSRLYLVIEKIRNNQGAFAALAISVIFFIFIIFFIVKIFSGRRGNDRNIQKLSSSENETQYK